MPTSRSCGNLQTDESGQEVTQEAWHFLATYRVVEFNTTSEHFGRIAEEVPAEFGSPSRHLIVLFPETYDLGPAPVEWRGSVGVGSNYSADGGLAIMSAWILRDEFCAATWRSRRNTCGTARRSAVAPRSGRAG